ncbi:hypothetical protein T4D_15096 [Trichinella pseudospiralis]|uniref:Uncharacterized protein n=1 Tax=Trichinella pseudospiralis TaxID=6337 RepID=A0A0V1FXA3_TRIPS|nr:hypothetical protein T4D_15096 [Trichinella pseudospiralis]
MYVYTMRQFFGGSMGILARWIHHSKVAYFLCYQTLLQQSGSSARRSGKEREAEKTIVLERKPKASDQVKIFYGTGPTETWKCSDWLIKKLRQLFTQLLKKASAHCSILVAIVYAIQVFMDNIFCSIVQELIKEGTDIDLQCFPT